MNRRHLLAFLAGLPATGVLAAAHTPPRLQQLGERLHLMPGQNDEPRRANRGLVVNTAILVGPQGALVVDPGPHAQAGHALRAAVRNELGLPVVGVVNTHAAPEYVLGNAAFAGLPIHASATTRRLMAQRCQRCLARLRALLGPSAMRGTRIVLPTHTLDPGDGVVLHGLRLDVRVFEQAHSPGDTALFDPGSATLLGGALAFRDRVPDLQEASLQGWLQALQALQQWPARQFVGAGVGPMADTVQATQDYLRWLEQDIVVRVRRGDNPADMGTALPDPWAQWVGAQRRHALNVQRVWREVEDRWWRGELPG